MTSNDRSQHELQVNTSALPGGLWEKLLEAVYAAWLNARLREVRGREGRSVDPFLAMSRYWWRA
jgi:hypothetical protein